MLDATKMLASREIRRVSPAICAFSDRLYIRIAPAREGFQPTCRLFAPKCSHCALSGAHLWRTPIPLNLAISDKCRSCDCDTERDTLPSLSRCGPAWTLDWACGSQDTAPSGAPRFSP